MPSAIAAVEMVRWKSSPPRCHTSPLAVTPLYLRRPDIDPNVERRLAAGGG